MAKDGRRARAERAAARAAGGVPAPAVGSCVLCMCLVFAGKDTLSDTASSGATLAGCKHPYCTACMLKRSWKSLPSLGQCAVPGCVQPFVTAKVFQWGAGGGVTKERVSLAQVSATQERLPGQWMLPQGMLDYAAAPRVEQAKGFALAVFLPRKNGAAGASLYAGRLAEGDATPSPGMSAALLAIMAALCKTVVLTDVKGTVKGVRVPVEPAGRWYCVAGDTRWTTKLMQTLAVGSSKVCIKAAGRSWEEGRRAIAGFVMAEVAIGANDPLCPGVLQRFLGGSVGFLSKVDMGRVLRNLNLASTADAYMTGVVRSGVSALVEDGGVHKTFHSVDEVCPPHPPPAPSPFLRTETRLDESASASVQILWVGAWCPHPDFPSPTSFGCPIRASSSTCLSTTSACGGMLATTSTRTAS